MGFCVEFASFLCLLTYANTQSSLPKLFTQSTSFIFQNLDYLTKHETKSEKLELDESTRQKLHKIISEPDIEADIAWIEVSNLLKKFIAFFLKKKSNFSITSKTPSTKLSSVPSQKQFWITVWKRPSTGHTS